MISIMNNFLINRNHAVEKVNRYLNDIRQLKYGLLYILAK